MIILTLKNQWTLIIFCIFLWFSIFVIEIFHILSYICFKVFEFFKYFVAIVNGTELKISFSTMALFVHTEATDFFYWFYILQLYKFQKSLNDIFHYFYILASCHLQLDYFSSEFLLPPWDFCVSIWILELFYSNLIKNTSRKKIFCLLVQYPNIYKSQGWAKPKSETWDSTWTSQVNDRILSSLAIFCCFLQSQ